MTMVPRTRGPASANHHGRKPREVLRSCASDAMGISARAVCCRDALTGSLGSGRWGGGLGRPIATSITGVARRRLIDEAAVEGGATASMIVAGREPAKAEVPHWNVAASWL